jgi:hypothetical protein
MYLFGLSALMCLAAYFFDTIYCYWFAKKLEIKEGDKECVTSNLMGQPKKVLKKSVSSNFKRFHFLKILFDYLASFVLALAIVIALIGL